MDNNRELSLKYKFAAFHRRNPHVYSKIKELVFLVQSRGKHKFGMMAIFNRIRWMSEFETVGDIYKINNNYQPYYARMLSVNEPTLSKMFQFRRVQDDFSDEEYRRLVDVT
jgi:hypothetical protein